MKRTINQIGLDFYNTRDTKYAGELYNKLSYPLFQYILPRVGDYSTTKDVLHRVWEQLLLNIDKYNPKKAKFTTWIWTFARNYSSDVHTFEDRFNRIATIYAERQPEIEYPKLLSYIENGTAIVFEHKEEAQNFLVKKILAVLKEVDEEEFYKDLFVKKYLHDFTFKELAEEYNLEFRPLIRRITKIKNIIANIITEKEEYLELYSNVK